MNATTLRRYAVDPLAFLADLVIPSAQGPLRFGNIVADFQHQRFAALAPALLAVARGEKPAIGRYWWEATKGASKDSDLACCLLWLLAFSRRPLTCQVGAADADQAAELRKAAKDILRLNGWLAGRVSVQNWKLLCTATGSACDIISSDEAGSHGARPDVLILNELSHITKQEFAENLADNAAKVPHGLVVIATNAGYLDTLAWRWRELARQSERWSFHQWAKPSPWLDSAEIEEARIRNSNACFQRLWFGIWASGGGDAIEREDIEAAITLTGPLTATEAERERWQAVAGLDLGIKHDRSAFVVLACRPGSQRIRVASVESWKPPRGGQVDLSRVEAAVVRAHQWFHLRSVHYDPHQAGLMAQRLRRVGVPCEEVPFVGRNLDDMATTIMEVFRSRIIDLYDDSALVRDLSKLNIVEKSFGQKLEAPADADGHADTAVALAIALPHAVRMAARTALTVPEFVLGRSVRDVSRYGIARHEYSKRDRRPCARYFPIN
jgi:hypothetical protein